jgi:hypothetical protein
VESIDSRLGKDAGPCVGPGARKRTNGQGGVIGRNSAENCNILRAGAASAPVVSPSVHRRGKSWGSGPVEASARPPYFAPIILEPLLARGQSDWLQNLLAQVRKFSAARLHQRLVSRTTNADRSPLTLKCMTYNKSPTFTPECHRT